MDIYQLKTFAAVAREGSITRASERVHLSQPAVSAHIKTLEETLGVSLFERTPRGMSLTREGEALLAKAERILAAHEELMVEASRLRGGLSGRLRVGASSSSRGDLVGRFVTTIAERYPDVDVLLEHAASTDILIGIRNGTLDAGMYNEAATPGPELATVDLSSFGIFVVAPPGLVDGLDWGAMARHPWIYPASSACCGLAAEGLFKTHRIRPQRIISVDREDVTQTLIRERVGIGLLHADTARTAEACGEVELIVESPTVIRVLFAHLASRARDPLLVAAAEVMADLVRR